jgi:hypothetical protein
VERSIVVQFVFHGVFAASSCGRQTHFSFSSSGNLKTVTAEIFIFWEFDKKTAGSDPWVGDIIGFP